MQKMLRTRCGKLANDKVKTECSKYLSRASRGFFCFLEKRDDLYAPLQASTYWVCADWNELLFRALFSVSDRPQTYLSAEI